MTKLPDTGKRDKGTQQQDVYYKSWQNLLIESAYLCSLASNKSNAMINLSMYGQTERPERRRSEKENMYKQCKPNQSYSCRSMDTWLEVNVICQGEKRVTKNPVILINED